MVQAVGAMDLDIVREVKMDFRDATDAIKKHAREGFRDMITEIYPKLAKSKHFDSVLDELIANKHFTAPERLKIFLTSYIINKFEHEPKNLDCIVGQLVLLHNMKKANSKIVAEETIDIVQTLQQRNSSPQRH